jgi:23S rRNA pseudouridine1911/1915/1917 synthase
MAKRRARLNVLYEDGEVLAVDKPAGVIVHPAPGHENGSLLDDILEYCPSIAGVGSATRPGIVHRLDIETSGVLVVAKTTRSYLALRKAFEDHGKIKKTYVAVLHGAPESPEGKLVNLIGRKPWDAHRMAVVEKGGDKAITSWRTLGMSGKLALVEFSILTGRTHQIRVHAAHLGHPVVGDALYGKPELDMKLSRRPRRQLLHAVCLEFPHPVSGRIVSVTSSPPADILFAR